MVDSPIAPFPRVTAIRRTAVPALRHVGWFGVFLVLAPVIGPRGYGLFVLALSGVAIIEALLRDTGIDALTRRSAIEERHWSTALVSLIAAGAAGWLLLYAVSRLFGPEGDGPALRDMFQSLAILPLLGGLTAVPTAALRRADRKMPPIAAEAAGFAGGAAVALWLAQAGAGPWSLVAQIVVQRLVECVVLWSIPAERIGFAWSRRHFAELASVVDARAIIPALPAVSRHAACLVVGAMLGPTATGLYMLAARLAEALTDAFLVDPPRHAANETVSRACRVALPAVLASTLLPIALPPLLELRWLGAISPARFLLLGVLPAALVFVRSAEARDEPGEAHRRVIEILGGIAIVALTAPDGLTTMAMATLGWSMASAAASLGPIREKLGPIWRAALANAARPLSGAALAGLLLFALADPIGASVAFVPALCLLTAAAWFVYLVVRGDPIS